MSTIKWAILGGLLCVAVIGALCIGCYFEGRRVERAANQQQIADIQATLDTERIEHQRAMEAYAAGDKRVTDGLIAAIGNAASSASRSERLETLMDAIESALLEYGITLDK